MGISHVLIQCFPLIDGDECSMFVLYKACRPEGRLGDVMLRL